MTSREIAELTGKQHKHVLRDIEAMFSQLSFESADGSNFGPSDFLDSYKHSIGRTLKQYRLDRDLKTERKTLEEGAK
ncbi:Rha family transcriptional regulator [Thalassotalea piscium]